MGKKSKKQKDGGKRSATPTEGKELSKSEKKQVMELVQELLQGKLIVCRHSNTDFHSPGFLGVQISLET